VIVAKGVWNLFARSLVMAELLQLQPAAMSRELCFSKRHMKHGGRLVSIGYLQSAASN
jgi:hypothetical protein